MDYTHKHTPTIVESSTMPLDDIVPNKGQIMGVPKNPRLIRNKKFDLLKRSIVEDPEMLGLREILVYPYEGKNIIIGGNMRYHALKDLGYTEAIVKVLPQDTPPEKLRAIVIKDNSAFGEWEFDDLANDWDINELANWGLDLPDVDEYGTEFSLPNGEKSNSEHIAFTLSTEQAEFIKNAIAKIKKNGLQCETFGNTNGNGNALYQIVVQWAGQKK